MRSVVIGAKGQLGRQFIQDYGFPGFDLETIDITKPVTFETIKQQRPEVIINCAAYTAVDQAEEQREIAQAVNVDGPRNLAKLAKELNAVLVHISTDYVFNGLAYQPYTEQSQTNPINFYGQTKLAGELAVSQSGAKFIIARTAWLYGMNGPNFILTMLKLAQEHSELKVVTDQVGSPTWTHDLARAIVELLTQQRLGLFNITNVGNASRFGVVEEICRIANLKTKLVRATTAEFPTPAKRPAYSVLSNSKLAAYYQMPDWKVSLKKYLDEVLG